MTVAGTNPYPWPYSGRFEPARTALVLVAVQPWALPRTAPADAALTAAEVVAETLRPLGGVVVWTRHRRPATWRRPTPLPGAGEPLIVTGDRREEDAVVDCAGFDAFSASDLDDRLRAAGRDHLLLAGGGLETAVHSTMRSANDRGYECLLLADACVAADPGLVGPAVSQICMSGGIFGAVGSAAAVIAALTRESPKTLEVVTP